VRLGSSVEAAHRWSSWCIFCSLGPPAVDSSLEVPTTGRTTFLTFLTLTPHLTLHVCVVWMHL